MRISWTNVQHTGMTCIMNVAIFLMVSNKIPAWWLGDDLDSNFCEVQVSLIFASGPRTSQSCTKTLKDSILPFTMLRSTPQITPKYCLVAKYKGSRSVSM
ncbi:hypothetical protein AVEN_259793-1 [Araneus ventricosus]|uniref:Uncharacterized protein n=1 Tax=Araneus ventricosus TaxID=182803 RepID=A0A4Y2KQX3_ARAVE|nr:hypothetical protein AVEN_259793-1 [Araneus ventricosus]